MRDAPGPGRPLHLDGWRDWRVGVLAALLALMVAGWVLRVWEASAGVPWFWYGDNKSFLLMFQNIQTTGWWTTSETIGGGGVNIAEFPFGGGALAQVLGVRLLGLLVRDPITLYNTYFLLSVPAAALAAYYAFRRLAVRPWFALTVSVLYSVLPYHFNRGHRGHIFLAAYAAVPLAAILIVRHAKGEAVLVRGTAAPVVKSDRRAHLIEAVLIALLVGASTLYYALMFVLLLLLVALAASIRSRSDVVFTSAFRTTMITGVALVAGLVPTVLAWASSGVSPSVGRPYASSEVFSFKIISAILPVEDHRFPPFAYLREQISGSPVPGEGPESLGLVGVFGAVLLLWWVVRRTLATDEDMGAQPLPNLGPLAVCALLALLVSTTGGLGALLSAVGISFLRSWARMGIFIGFFVLAAVGLWLQARATSANWTRRRCGTLLGAILVLGVLDQTTPQMAPDHELLHTEHRQDVAYVRAIEDEIGPDARVLQLPYMTYPENSEPIRVQAYDPLRWTLTGSTLRWSFGAPKDGRADWQRTVSRISARGIAAAARVTDYDAIMIDRRGYEGGGTELLEELEGLLGPPLMSETNRFATFLREDEAALQGDRFDELEALVQRATVIESSSGFHDTTRTVGQSLEATDDAAWLEVDPGPDLEGPLTVTVRPLAGPFRLTAWTGADRQVLTVSEQVTFDVGVPTGRSEPFFIEFDAEPLTDFDDAAVRWELVDVELPLDDALREAVQPS